MYLLDRDKENALLAALCGGPMTAEMVEIVENIRKELIDRQLLQAAREVKGLSA